MTNAQLIAADPGWLILVKALLVFAGCVVLTLMAVWGERRLVGRMQQRPGPNRVGPFGLIQSLADGVKLALKEDIIPTAADKIVFVIAPIISATTAYFSIDKRKMGDPLFVGELMSDITNVSGVVNVVEIKVFNKTGGEYSSSEVSVAYKVAATKEIGQTDMTIHMKSNQIFQIRFPNKDIKIRVKTTGTTTY